MCASYWVRIQPSPIPKHRRNDLGASNALIPVGGGTPFFGKDSLEDASSGRQASHELMAWPRRINQSIESEAILGVFMQCCRSGPYRPSPHATQ